MQHHKAKKNCHKVGYKSAGEAREALNTFGRGRGAVRFYKCPYPACKDRPYHLTSEASEKAS